MKYKIDFCEGNLKIIEDFHFLMDEFRNSIEARIPKGQLDNMSIVYTDDYGDGYEYKISYSDFIDTLDNKILMVLENMERIEPTKDTEETITIY